MARLLVTQHNGREDRITVDASRFVMGRQSDCDLYHVFANVTGVSRQHACIVKRDGTYTLHDLHSRNGTRLNQKKLLQPTELVHGDEFSIAGVRFKFEHDSGAFDQFVPLSLHDEKVSIRSTVSLSESRWLEPPAPKDASRKLSSLIQLLSDLGESFDVIEIYERLLSGLFNIFPEAEHGFVGVVDEDDQVVPRAMRSRGGADRSVSRASQTVIRRVLESKEAVLSSNARDDGRFRAAQSVAFQNIQSIMCAPLLLHSGDAIGVIQLESGDSGDRFTAEDLEILASITPHAGASLEYARMHAQQLARQSIQQDLDLARQIQRNLLPAHPPAIPGLGFFSYYEAANQIGGDHFDYFILPEGRVGVVVSDVAGKGVAAALLMSKFAAEFKYVLSRDQSLGQAATYLNDLLCEDDGMSRFVTMAAIIIDTQRGEAQVVNAGHTPILLRQRTLKVSAIGEENKGMPLGMFPDQKYQISTTAFQRGESIVLYTDGLNEAADASDTLYGYDRVVQSIELAPEDAAGLGNHILQEMREFVGDCPQSDDMCLVCINHIR